eukprot:624220-Amphidinium_carterae.1
MAEDDMPVDEGMQLEDLAGVEGDFEVPDEDREFTLPGTATYEAASVDPDAATQEAASHCAGRGQTLEAREAASTT